MPLLLCPNCNASMTEVKRNDVAFDMCPTCRGVWLDRGELEKIISAVQAERAEIDRERAQYTGQPAPQQRPQSRPDYGHGDQRRDYDDRRDYGDRGQQARRKRGGFDLFDIFD